MDKFLRVRPCLLPKLKHSQVHLNKCSRRNKQMTFSGQHYGQISQGLSVHPSCKRSRKFRVGWVDGSIHFIS